MRRAAAERQASKAKRDADARYDEWLQSKEGKKHLAKVGRQLEECEISSIKDDGVTSPEAIAAELNRRKFTTARDGKWTSRSVLKVLARL